MGPCEDFGFYSKRNAKSLGGLGQSSDVSYQNESGCCAKNRPKSHSLEFPKSVETLLLLLLNITHNNSGGTWLLPRPEPRITILSGPRWTAGSTDLKTESQGYSSSSRRDSRLSHQSKSSDTCDTEVSSLLAANSHRRALFETYLVSNFRQI